MKFQFKKKLVCDDELKYSEAVIEYEAPKRILFNYFE